MTEEERLQELADRAGHRRSLRNHAALVRSIANFHHHDETRDKLAEHARAADGAAASIDPLDGLVRP